MLKIFLSLVFISCVLFSAGLKPTGCDLSQVGDVEFSIGSKNSKKADYKAISPSGKNFRSILVGSTMAIDGDTLKIVDIKANKRVKREARTGSVSVVVNADGASQNIEMVYSYSKGHFSANGELKNGKNVSFALDIKALLCHAE